MLRPPTQLLARWILLILASLFSPLLKAQSNSVEELETVRANLSQALEYRDQAAKESFAWQLRRGEMENLILIAEEERKNLQATIAMARPILVDLQTRRTDLASNEADSKILVDFLQTAVPALAKRLLEKSNRWPELLLSDAREPLHKIRVIFQQEIQSLSLGDLEKLIQSTVEALEEALKFQKDIHRSSLLKTLPDGREALFDVVFIGLGGGYYVSNDLKLAGSIVPSDGDWQWIPQDDLVEPLGSFIDIAKEESPATWIHLPVGITTEALSQ